MIHEVSLPPKPLKQEASTQVNYCGEFSNAEDVKPDLNPNDTLKVTADELTSFFCHEVFGQLKNPGHQCTICGRVFSFRYQLIVHARYHTLPDGGKANILAEDKLSNWSTNQQKKENKVLYPCSYCEKSFSRKEHLVSHVASHTVLDPSFPAFFSNGNACPGENPHECHLCSKTFSRKDHLENHLRVHDSDFKCHICQKIFTRKEHLVNHVQWHTGTSPHRCGLCRKVFTRKEHLVNHVRQHTGESPHVCRFCGKAFTRKEHVVNHERGHTGETPFKCAECGRAFSRRDHLVTHERSHAGLSPFKCFPCGKAFTKKEHLANHQRQHHAGQPMIFPP